MNYTVTIIENVPGIIGAKTTYQREITMQQVPTVIKYLLDLPEPKPPRAPRKDKGVSRSDATPAML